MLRMCYCRLPVWSQNEPVQCVYRLEGLFLWHQVLHNKWADGRFCVVYCMTGSQPAAAMLPVDQCLRMAETIVISMKGTTTVEKEK